MPPVLTAFVIAVVVCQFALFLTTVFLHRALSHKAITLSPPVRFTCRVLTWVTTGIRPRQWAAVHRKHHAYTDVEGDPHSPLLEGFWTVQLANAALYRKVARDGETVQRYAKDIPADRWDRVLFDHALVGLGTGVAILYLIFGWEIALIAGAFHAVLYLALNAAINAIGHFRGKTVYDNTARNNQWLAFLTAGEGLHNNHHAAPTSAKLAHRRFEIDPGYWVIRALVGARQASVRLAEPRIISRRPVPVAAAAAVGATAPVGPAVEPAQPAEPVEAPV